MFQNNALYFNKKFYFVIIYVGHFWPSNFGPIYFRSLIYTLISLLFTPVCHRRLSLFVSVEHVQGAQIRVGREGS